jgi:hypothetical protein
VTTYDDPFRLRLLKGLTDVLEGITPANGFKHDLSAAVFRGRLTYGAKDPLPMVAIIEPPIVDPAAPVPSYSTASVYPYQVIIQGFAKDDAKHPTDPAYRLLADVKMAIGREIRRVQQHENAAFGVARRRFTEVCMDLGVVRPSDDISSQAFFWLPVRFTFAEDYLAPYED